MQDGQANMFLQVVGGEVHSLSLCADLPRRRQSRPGQTAVYTCYRCASYKVSVRDVVSLKSRGCQELKTGNAGSSTSYIPGVYGVKNS